MNSVDWQSLGLEIWSIISSFSDLQSHCALRQSCHYLYELTNIPAAWPSPAEIHLQRLHSSTLLTILSTEYNSTPVRGLQLVTSVCCCCANQSEEGNLPIVAQVFELIVRTCNKVNKLALKGELGVQLISIVLGWPSTIQIQPDDLQRLELLPTVASSNINEQIVSVTTKLQTLYLRISKYDSI